DRCSMGIISITPLTEGLGPFSPSDEQEQQVFGGRFDDPGSVTIFEVHNLPQQVGSKFTLDSGPIFQQTVDYLTNGQEGPLDFQLRDTRGIGGQGFSKRHFNGGYPAVDLRGFTIEGLDLTVDSFRTVPDPEGPPTFLMSEVHITFVIRGEFPLWWRAWRHRFAVFVLGALFGALVVWLVLALLAFI